MKVYVVEPADERQLAPDVFASLVHAQSFIQENYWDEDDGKFDQTAWYHPNQGEQWQSSSDLREWNHPLVCWVIYVCDVW